MFLFILDVHIYRKESGNWAQIPTSTAEVGDLVDEEDVVTISKTGDSAYSIIFPTVGKKCVNIWVLVHGIRERQNYNSL